MIVVGVDESGTGALAGPFTVCAVAAWKRDFSALRQVGVADSKKLTDKRRRQLIAAISDVVLGASYVSVGAEATFNPGMKPAWRGAVIACIDQVVGLLTPDRGRKIEVIVDGLWDGGVLAGLRHHSELDVRFQQKADVHVAPVSAASVLAKTVRNDLMLELHQRHPEYGWHKNFGYGTSAHHSAIQKYGLCSFHRRIKTLAHYPTRKDS
jgi:ribonuclease HII